MTEESEARWAPIPTEPPLVSSSVELLFLTEDELAAYDADALARSLRAPMGFAPARVSSPAPSRTPPHRDRQEPSLVPSESTSTS